MTDMIERAVEPITTADVAGLVGTTTQPINGPDPAAAIAAIVARRTERMRRFLDAIATVSFIGKPWVPDLSPPTGGGEQTAEKTETPVTVISIGGTTVTPAVIGAAANVSWQVSVAPGGLAVVELLLREIALRRVLDYVCAQLAAPLQATIQDAIEAVEAAGWIVDFIAGPTSLIYEANLANLDRAGVRIFGGVPSPNLIVGDSGGVWGTVSDTTARRTEPSIAGYDMAAWAEVVCQYTAGAVSGVTRT